MTNLTPFERALIEHVRDFCRSYPADSDNETLSDIWFVMEGLRVFEQRGVATAISAMQRACKASDRQKNELLDLAS